MRITWDARKAAENRRKHGVSFEEGATVLSSPTAVSYPDPDHSHSEDRYVVIGFSSVARLLLVCYCYRSDEEIRVISTRKATPKEREEYAEGI
jgi:uncharacterized DUF497 family protein